jgi:hypothetical protein
MASRIPPSPNWLIDKRAGLASEVEQARASITAAKRLIEEFNAIEAEDEVLSVAVFSSSAL